MATDPAIRWIGSPNFRKLVSVKHGVVFHWIVGYLASADARFTQPRQTATQYAVGPKAIHQYVEDQYRAPGTGHNGANTNYISIEHEAGYQHNGTYFPGSAEMLENSAQLVAFLSRKHGWGKMVPGVNAFGHREFVATMCPGTLPWHWVCDRANEINGQQGGVPTNPGGTASLPTGKYNGYDIRTIQAKVGAVQDGIYGPDTKRMVALWQGANGLEADGVVGPRTWAKMVGVTVTPATSAPAKPLTAPHAAHLAVDGGWGVLTTQALQRALRVSADGVIGPKTIRALQARVGARVDGIAGPITRKRLQRHLGVRQDAIWGPGTVRALQNRLNAGTF